PLRPGGTSPPITKPSRHGRGPPRPGRRAHGVPDGTPPTTGTGDGRTGCPRGLAVAAKFRPTSLTRSELSEGKLSEQIRQTRSQTLTIRSLPSCPAGPPRRDF